MFCKTVWQGLHILPYGDIRLCSIGNNADRSLGMQTARDKDGNIMNILTHSIKDIMNSQIHKEVRALNIADPSAWSKHCDCCETREAVINFDRTHKNMSRRIYLMQIPTEDTATEENYLDKALPDGTIDWYPASLDIRFGNLCNQKCIMCSPEYSHLWYDDWQAWTDKKTFSSGSQVTFVKDKNNKWIQPDQLKWYEDPRWWPKFEEMMPHLKHIYVTGGEPMIVPAHDIMLDKLIESGYAKNIVLEYDTNGSVVNDKLAERWFHFKGVDIRCSMDATHEQYELIRFGGKWERFVENIQKLKEYSKQSSGRIKISAMTSCFQLSTIYSTLKSEEWCKSMGLNFHIRFLAGPPWHRVLNLPLAARNEIYEFYKTADTDKAKMIRSFLERNKDITWDDPEHIRTFVKFMDLMDERRGTQWRTVLPDLNSLIERYVP